jgi:quinoprotein glucose dehydrogenase
VVLDRFFKLRPHTLYAPPSTQGTIILPGFDGGGEWGGAAADPEGVLYVNGNEMPWIITMSPRQVATNGAPARGEELFSQICAACHGLDRKGNPAQNTPPLMALEGRLSHADIIRLMETGKGVMPSFAFLSTGQKAALADHLLGTHQRDVIPEEATMGRTRAPAEADALGTVPYSVTGFHRWFDTNGYPAIKPPWGTLNAIDLNTGEYRWRVPLGEDPKLSARGIPITGLENYGGPLVTAGDLVFIAATKDEMFRAFDRRSGKMLWQARLPAGGYASPATYAVDGRQYVVIACGGGKMGTRSGDAYVAFCLPARLTRATQQ